MALAPLAYAGGGLVLLRVFLSLAPPLLSLLVRWWRSVEDGLHPYHHYKVPRYDESLRENPLYRRAAAYISSLPSLEDSDYANIFSSPSSSSTRTPGGGDHLSLRLEDGRTVEDSFLGVRISWTNFSDAALVLRIRRQDRQRVLRPYLDHVESVAEELEHRRRELRLYTNCAGGAGRRWTSVPFTHPATLDTLAMDPDLKGRVRSDLESFLKGRSHYHRLGRVWKRSYLLYGPTGTGKSSFAAAMARFLCYDVYDLDPAHAADGSDLNALLLQTTPRSVIVVEDLDRYLHTAPGVGLSGILSFMDGVFSCCGEERVMVFTMNGVKERVDPAVLRPGRADVHIYFALCDFSGFKAMASGYLGIKDHKLYPQVEEAFQGGARLSQAEMGEIMLANRGSPGRALKAVIGALRRQQWDLGAEATTGSPLQAEEEPPAAGKDGSAGNIRKLYGQITVRRDSRGGFRRLFRRKSNRTEK
ncbi:hypothetical protein Taro_002683 [Colocasia esculenta]|uniref:AAA+ ATPase domain-containing protein n=1 Tax=Colocasia esculenta TaxID=4460 RepID=A0A843THR7_COLES|nr:hypothetical protein [Colocasia esculenta]